MISPVNLPPFTTFHAIEYPLPGRIAENLVRMGKKCLSLREASSDDYTAAFTELDTHLQEIRNVLGVSITRREFRRPLREQA